MIRRRRKKKTATKPRFSHAEKVAFAAKMRAAPTPPERQMALLLESAGLAALFASQVIVRGYIADFYCASKKLVVEVDGGTHRLAAGRRYDRRRDRHLADAGITTLRFTATEVFHNPRAVLAQILAFCGRS